MYINCILDKTLQFESEKFQFQLESAVTVLMGISVCAVSSSGKTKGSERRQAIAL